MAAPILRQLFKSTINVNSRIIPRCLHRTTPLQQPLVTKETMGAITLIGINRPNKKNAINLQTADELTTKFKDFLQTDSERVAILYGHGGTFCTGFDLAEVEHAFDNNLQEIRSSEDGPLGPTRMTFNKPVIAAVEGYAVAGGLELALMCDLRLADESAIFGVLCRRYGVPLIDGGTVRLPALIGLSRAMDLILTGREIEAKEAAEIGLVNKVYPTGTVLGQAMKIADSLSKFPQTCLNADRQSAYHAAYSGQNLRDCLIYERDNAYSAAKDLGRKDLREKLDKYKR